MLLIIAAVVVLLLAGGAFVYLTRSNNKDDGEGSSKPMPGTGSGSMGPVPMEDFVSLFNRLRPDSTHMDILLAILAMNDVLQRATDDLDRIQDMREKRKKQLQEEEDAKSKKEKSNQVDFDDLVNEGGWGDDDDDDDDKDGDDDATKNNNLAVQKAKEEEKRKADELARLRKAQGKELPPMEGLDKGVLGQEWVENTLAEHKAWPPALGALANETFVYQPKSSRKPQQLKPLDHPAFRRCLCMTLGRLHSAQLNAHPQLVEAGLQKLVDETYFKGSMEFRQRMALILDAALRIALTIQSFPLFGQLVETLAAFKIGCVPTDPKSLPWFNGTMARQYNTLPRLEIGKVIFEAPKSDEQVAAEQKLMQEAAAAGGTTPPPLPPSKPLSQLQAGKQAVIVLPVDRKHAEAFTKVKIAQCQKQGIPPQIALQGYREAWWFLVRWQVEGEDKSNSAVENAMDDIPRKFIDQLDAEALERFENTPASLRVRTAFPMMVQNIAQKSGAVKVRITAPTNPGNYTLVVAVKSQDFLGADQEVSIPMKVVEATTDDDDDDDAADEDKNGDEATGSENKKDK